MNDAVKLLPASRSLTTEEGTESSAVAEAGETPTRCTTPREAPAVRGLVDALEEPTLIVERDSVSFANGPATVLLGRSIEGRDVRLAIRHPGALQHILTTRSGDIEVVGIGEADRPWRVVVRDLGHGGSLVRLIDRTAAIGAEKMRVDFVANASHELRTPLATVIGYSETIADNAALRPETRTKFATTVRDEGVRMLRIIDDLMGLSRIQADRFVEPAEVVRLDQIMRTAISSARPCAKEHQAKINLKIPDEMPSVKGDHGQLLQLFDNLLGNALCYGCEKPRSQVDINISVQRGWITISVTDHGPGIAREHIPRLTERFYRINGTRHRHSGGTGLGLAIVKHIVERHRGALDIKSELGAGTSVSVRLPVTTEDR